MKERLPRFFRQRSRQLASLAFHFRQPFPFRLKGGPQRL